LPLEDDIKRLGSSEVELSSATDRFHSDASMVPGDPKIPNALEIASSEPVEANGVVISFPSYYAA
jgi:hypothetical protein